MSAEPLLGGSGTMVMLSTLAGSEELPAWIDENNNRQVHAVQIIKFSSKATSSVIQARIAKHIYGLDTNFFYNMQGYLHSITKKKKKKKPHHSCVIKFNTP